MSRLFRLAEIINYKYNLRIDAAEIPAPSKLVMTVKDNLIELYNNFFNEKSFLEKKVGVISAMNALFHLKGLSEPNTEELFHQMNKLISEIDKLVLLDECGETTSDIIAGTGMILGLK